jgi:hypothetical protein
VSSSGVTPRARGRRPFELVQEVRMLRKSNFLIAVVVASVMTSCATGTETHKTPDRAGIESYRDLNKDELEEPWQAASSPYAAPPAESATKAGEASASSGIAAEELKITGRSWQGRFVLKEFMPVVNPDLLGLKQIYMCADQRIHRSEMEPPPEGGVTKTRVAVRAEKAGSDWLILSDREPEYRMFQVIRWLQIVRAVSWAGAEHVLLGTVSFGGVTFESDPAFPLHFKLIEDVGYVHVCGRGPVTTPEGRTYPLGQEKALSQFLEDLTARDQLAQEAASEALGWLARTRSEIDKALPALVSALKNDAMEVRRNAAASLRRIGDERAVEGLRAALQDEKDEWVRDVMTDALKKLRGVAD